MAQFDVFRSSRPGVYPLVLDMQADLTPIMSVRGEEYVLMFPLMASVPKASLGDIVGSLAPHRATLIAALDLLITGS